MTTINFTGGSRITVAEAYNVVKTKLAKHSSFEVTKFLFNQETGKECGRVKATVQKPMVTYIEEVGQAG